MTWADHHRRSGALNKLVERLERDGAAAGGRLPAGPWDEVFADEADVLDAVHALWSRRLAARVELALEVGEDLPDESVATAWHELAAELPAVRRVLDARAPELVAHEQHEHRLLAIAAGLALPDTPLDRAAAAGAQLVARLRRSRPAPPTSGSLWERMTRRVRREDGHPSDALSA